MWAVDHPGRLRRAAAAAGERGIDALLVTPSADLVYLTAYAPPQLERLTCLVIRPHADPVVVVPQLERPLAEDGVGKLAALASWGETDDPYALVAGIVGPARRMGCSDRMWASHVLGLQGAAPDVRFEAASGVLGSLRAVKDGDELALLKRAARYADETFRRIVGLRLETMTERAVASALGELLVEIGHDQVAFTIVGSGPNGASPHHEPGHRELHAGDAVVMDFGGRTAGYCSDLSRTVAIKRAGRSFRAVYEVVREAQERAFHAVAPGVSAQDVDRAAREVIEQAGYGDLFVHRTGHGIGLEEHEAPYIVEGNDEPLRPGMCFSIEPGIYLPGEFGVRIEDIVTVTDGGATRLNHASRDLEVVG
ncbi:MAG: aminopeptidase P family protein [Actinomycetota bacterium]